MKEVWFRIKPLLRMRATIRNVVLLCMESCRQWQRSDESNEHHDDTQNKKQKVNDYDDAEEEDDYDPLA
ncbi:hypothetical protein J6895_01053 [Nakaseomyces glabratus]|nr:hypothetical protein J6895_01053 [Nakaseomyces glabratus]